MMFAKLASPVLDDLSAFSGIAVVCDDIHAARHFGPSGPDDGSLEGHRMLALAPRFSRPADRNDLRAAVEGGLADGDSACAALSDDAVRNRLSSLGFDAYVGLEWAEGAPLQVVVLWDPERLHLHLEPEAVSDFVVTEAQDGDLVVCARSIRAREAVMRVCDACQGNADDLSRAVLRLAIAGTCYSMPYENVRAPEGMRWDPLGLDPHMLVRTGTAMVPSLSPSPELMFC